MKFVRLKIFHTRWSQSSSEPCKTMVGKIWGFFLFYCFNGLVPLWQHFEILYSARKEFLPILFLLRWPDLREKTPHGFHVTIQSHTPRAESESRYGHLPIPTHPPAFSHLTTATNKANVKFLASSRDNWRWSSTLRELILMSCSKS